VLSPVVLTLSAAIHVKDDATVATSGMLTAPPLQIEALEALVIAGRGLTVTVTVCDVPTQLLAVDVGVTV
jgi:hypothetical protein